MTVTTSARLLAIATMVLAGPGVPGMSARAAPGDQGTASSPALPPDIAARVQQHNRALHDQLQITPQQQALWDRFAAVTVSNAADIGQAFNERGAKLDTMTAAENMQSFARVAQVHAANMQKAADTFQALYTTFSSQQKLVADDVFRNKLAGSPVGRRHAG